MQRKYFGTDGIRGTANQFPMTAEIAMRLGVAAGRYFGGSNGRRHTVVIGKDTRLSGYMVENALVAGFASVGMDSILTGPLPTPGVAMMTRTLRADLGVMISASHNKYQDNGLKLFGPDGYKLSDSIEAEIEALMEEPLYQGLAAAEDIGRAKRIDTAEARYVEICKGTFPRGMRLSGLKIVIDCANGAAYKAAPDVLWELGAEVIRLGVSPDGTNINKGCGSTQPALLAQTVRQEGAHVGIALDGDADRIAVCDEHGNIVDGDQLIGLIASRAKRDGSLRGNAVVTTVMSNLGLETYLQGQGIAMHRTKVGDRYVIDKMRQDNLNIGGEQSGHLVLADYATTGDGLIAGLQVLAAMVASEQSASQLLHVFEPAPQSLVNVRFAGTDPMTLPPVQAAIAAAEQRLIGRGRLLVRKSGTEPLVRVMAEADDQAFVDEIVNEVASIIRKAAS